MPADFFYLERLGCGMPDNLWGCLFTALMPLGQQETGKCVAVNSQKKLSFGTLNTTPHPDTFFLIKEAKV